MKRTLSLLLAVLMVLSVPITSSAAPADHKGASSWALDSIVEAEKIGLIPKELYPLNYKKPITREEFVALAVTLHELTTGKKIEVIEWYGYEYIDVDAKSPYVDYIYKAGVQQIAGETGRDKAYRPYFSPKGNLTREQAATIATRLLRDLGHIFKDLNEVQFNDVSKISDWALSGVQLMQSEGILTGVDNGNYAPKDFYTVEQSIVTMNRVYSRYNEVKAQREVEAQREAESTEKPFKQVYHRIYGLVYDSTWSTNLSDGPKWDAAPEGISWDTEDDAEWDMFYRKWKDYYESQGMTDDNPYKDYDGYWGVLTDIKNPEITDEYVTRTLMSYQSEYPTRTPWTNANSYTWKGGSYSTGHGCAGFAFMLSDYVFGDIPARYHTDYDSIKVGDIVTIENNMGGDHMVIITHIDGDVYTFAEGNFNDTVNWGRTRTLAQLKAYPVEILTRR
jgi:hypothetical protein